MANVRSCSEAAAIVTEALGKQMDAQAVEPLMAALENSDEGVRECG